MTGDRSLRLAAGLAAAETVVLIAVVMLRSGARTPLLVAALAVKLPFCVLVRHRSPGAFLGLLLWEAAAVFGALLAWSGPLLLRAAALAVSLTVIVLLTRSAHLFPSPRLPER